MGKGNNGESDVKQARPDSSNCIICYQPIIDRQTQATCVNCEFEFHRRHLPDLKLNGYSCPNCRKHVLSEVDLEQPVSLPEASLPVYNPNATPDMTLLIGMCSLGILFFFFMWMIGYFSFIG